MKSKLRIILFAISLTTAVHSSLCAIPLWDYMVKSEYDLVGAGEGKEATYGGDFKPLAHALDKLGREGWELISVTVVTDYTTKDASNDKYSNSIRYIFKRPHKTPDA